MISTVTRQIFKRPDLLKATASKSWLSTQATFSSSSDLVNTIISEETGLATLQMNRGPVNSLSLEMCQAISDSIKEVERSSTQGIVISSSLPGIFSGGLDLTEMYKPDPDRLVEFWVSFQQMFMDVYGSRLATVALIEGHAPAGGCMIAMACDYRIMVDAPKISIGLNETQFGIVAPPWMAELMELTIGHRQAEQALQCGTLFTPKEALESGLIDETVATSTDAVARANEEAAKWAKMPPTARVASKQLLRKPLLDRLQSTRQMDTERFVSFVTSGPVQKHLGRYLASLKSK